MPHPVRLRARGPAPYHSAVNNFKRRRLTALITVGASWLAMVAAAIGITIALTPYISEPLNRVLSAVFGIVTWNLAWPVKAAIFRTLGVDEGE